MHGESSILPVTTVKGSSVSIEYEIGEWKKKIRIGFLGKLWS